MCLSLTYVVYCIHLSTHITAVIQITVETTYSADAAKRAIQYAFSHVEDALVDTNDRTPKSSLSAGFKLKTAGEELDDDSPAGFAAKPSSSDTAAFHSSDDTPGHLKAPPEHNLLTSKKFEIDTDSKSEDDYSAVNEEDFDNELEDLPPDELADDEVPSANVAEPEVAPEDASIDVDGDDFDSEDASADDHQAEDDDDEEEEVPPPAQKKPKVQSFLTSYFG